MSGAAIIDRTNFTEHRPRPGIRVLNADGIEVGEIASLENGRTLTIRYWAHERGGRYRMPAIETKTGWTWTEAIEDHGFRFVVPPALETEAEETGAEPAAGDETVLRRVWKGEEVEVLATPSGFIWKGIEFSSISAAAKAIVGYSINGRAFFGLPPTRGT